MKRNYYKEFDRLYNVGINPYKNHDRWLNDLEDGKTYWTFFMSTSNSGDSLRDYTGLFQVKPTRGSYPRFHSYAKHQIYWEWEIVPSPTTKKWGKTIAHNIEIYMNGYGTATTSFFDNYEDAVAAHDMQILSLSSGLSVGKREAMRSKMISFGKTSIVVESTVRIKGTNAVIVKIDKMVFVSVDEDGRPVTHGKPITPLQNKYECSSCGKYDGTMSKRAEIRNEELKNLNR